MGAGFAPGGVGAEGCSERGVADVGVDFAGDVVGWGVEGESLGVGGDVGAHEKWGEDGRPVEGDVGAGEEGEGGDQEEGGEAPEAGALGGVDVN